jgi:hypothetical protein
MMLFIGEPLGERRSPLLRPSLHQWLSRRARPNERGGWVRLERIVLAELNHLNRFPA